MSKLDIAIFICLALAGYAIAVLVERYRAGTE
jgi:hypothetical protein